MKAAQCGFNGASVNTLIVLTATLLKTTYVQIKTVLILVIKLRYFPTIHSTLKPLEVSQILFYNSVTKGEILLCFCRFNIYKGVEASMPHQCFIVENLKSINKAVFVRLFDSSGLVQKRFLPNYFSANSLDCVSLSFPRRN